MEGNVSDTILKIAQGESVAKEEAECVANLFANTTTSVVVFASRNLWTKWKMLLSNANITSTLLLPEDDWRQNVDSALEFGDIIIIDSDSQGEEFYKAINGSEKVARKVIMRDYPIPQDSEPRSVTIYRNMKYLRPRSLSYATKVSVVLRHAVLPFDASKIPFLILDDILSNFIVAKFILRKFLGYPKDLVYKAIGNLEASFIMEKFHPLIVMTDFKHLGPSGNELVKTVCAQPEYDDVVIGFRTAQSFEEMIEYYYSIGADFFLDKLNKVENITAMLRSHTLTAQYMRVYNEVMAKKD